MLTGSGLSGVSEDVASDLIATIRPYTMTGLDRCRAMLKSVETIDREKIDGDIVECGVWCGGNIILARKMSPSRVCWLYDTFTGMTEPGPEDISFSGLLAADRHRNRQETGLGWCVASLDEVKANLSETGTYDESRLRFVVGDVCETLLNTANLPDKIALLRLDTDFYASTKAELEILWPRVVPGGILIVDDYGHWMGSQAAVDEYFAGQKINLHKIDYTAVMLRKS